MEGLLATFGGYNFEMDYYGLQDVKCTVFKNLVCTYHRLFFFFLPYRSVYAKIWIIQTLYTFMSGMRPENTCG